MLQIQTQNLSVLYMVQKLHLVAKPVNYTTAASIRQHSSSNLHHWPSLDHSVCVVPAEIYFKHII